MAISKFSFAPLTLAAADLDCMRGGRPVFSGVEFSLASGGLLALTGPNGSGKSSLLRLLAGLLPPAGGSIRLSTGVELIGDDEQITPETDGQADDLIHYFGHLDGLKSVFTLQENLAFWRALYGRGKSDSALSIGEAVARVGLGHMRDLPVSIFSAGQRRRAGLARLLTAPRPVWLLDEPTAALDSDGEAMLGELMEAHLANGGMIVAATHLALPVAPTQTLEMTLDREAAA
ncbi:MAG TPA: heme ABC exporter ATP-binding protein CcmA [Afifellaceae bacterium]|nr:heme ABC exporter ATP-binding protein CcmA [Afifellaceae bacterium]